MTIQKVRFVFLELNKEVCILKKLTKKTIIIVAILLVLFCIFLFFSISVKSLIYNIYNSNGNYSSTHIEDPAIVEEINVRHNVSDNVKDFSSKEIKENYNLSPLPIINLFSGKIYYTYSYEAYKNDDIIYGCSQIPVTLSIKWENLNWIIVDYYEPY